MKFNKKYVKRMRFMKNSKKKFLSLFVVAACAVSCSPIMGGLASAAPAFDDVSRYSVVPSVETLKNRRIEVNSSRQLSEAAKNAKANDVIYLNKDVALDSILNLDHSVQLDLGGHKITVGTGAGIIVGKKTFSHKDKQEIYHPGYYRTLTDYTNIYDAHGHVTGRRQTHRQQWVPGRTETIYKDVYNYDDSVDVIIKNGSIVRVDGLDGRPGLKDVSRGYHGEDGETPSAPIAILSGNLSLESIVVKGGKGGNGGKGGYQSLWHIPFGGGSAGNGGNGGNGGAAVSIDSKDHGHYSLEDTELIKGKPGKGAKAGEPNPNYWLYRGWKGSDGEDGK